ncbi:hypothetical protein [Actinosynnema mirum]|uniref:hypothetical protein n=1 Tax=Actinosynnema mirum TaxID=40567 RepID=UPI00019ACA85|nr:hypothetical protein [Actinosynnema mirum]
MAGRVAGLSARDADSPALTCAADPDQQLITWTAEPGSPACARPRTVTASGRPPS